MPVAIKDYLKTTKWLLLDSVFRLRKQSLLILIAQTVGTFMQASVIGLVVQYINLLETGSDFTIGNYTFEVKAELFVYVALIMLVFLAVAGWLLLVSRLKILEIGFDYNKFCSQRVFSIFFINRFSPQFYRKYGRSEVSRLASSTSARCGRVLRMLLRTIRPAVIVMIATGVLFAINPFLTIILAGLASATLIFQYRISGGVVRYSVLREEYSPKSTQSKKQILSDAAKFPSTMGRSLFDGNVARKFKEQSIASYYEVFKGWLAGTPKSGFVGDVLLAVSVFLVLVILMGDVLRTGQGWTGVIAYVIAVQFAFSNLRALNSSITGMNRFYPQVRRYRIYVDEFSQPRVEVAKTLIHLDSNAVYSLVMQKGLTLDVFLQKIDSNSEAGLAYVGTDFPFADISFAESLGLRELSWQDYWAVIQNTDMAELFQEDVKDGMNQEKPDSWGRLDGRLVFLMMLTTFIQSRAVYAIVNVDDVKNISRSTWDYVLSVMKEKTVVIKHNHSLDDIGDYSEKGIIFLHGKTFDIFSIDEFENNKSFIKERLRGPAAPKAEETPADELTEIDAIEEESTEGEEF